MVISCSALGCTNRQGKKEGLSFYRFPYDAERRARWVAAVNRNNWLPSSTSRLCNEHFISGKKSDNQYSPDYVPSVFNDAVTSKRRKASEGELYERRLKRQQKKREDEQRQREEEERLFKENMVQGPLLCARLIAGVVSSTSLTKKRGSGPITSSKYHKESLSVVSAENVQCWDFPVLHQDVNTQSTLEDKVDIKSEPVENVPFNNEFITVKEEPTERELEEISLQNSKKLSSLEDVKKKILAEDMDLFMKLPEVKNLTMNKEQVRIIITYKNDVPKDVAVDTEFVEVKEELPKDKLGESSHPTTPIYMDPEEMKDNDELSQVSTKDPLEVSGDEMEPEGDIVFKEEPQIVSVIPRPFMQPWVGNS